MSEVVSRRHLLHHRTGGGHSSHALWFSLSGLVFPRGLYWVDEMDRRSWTDGPGHLGLFPSAYPNQKAST